MRWTLVGRDPELGLARRALSEGGGGILLSGSAGVGKSRLAAEIAEAADQLGFYVERIAASLATRSVPFGAFAHLVPDVVAADRLQLLQMTRSSLRRNAGDKQLAVLVDDAHQLDEGSLALVHLLASHRDAFLILTMRTTDPVPDALVPLWKDDYVERMELSGLDGSAIDAIITQDLAEAGSDTRSAISRLAGGNPLLLKELLIEGKHSGTLVQEDQEWTVTGRFGHLPRLVDLVDARLRLLGDDARELFRALSVGSPLPLVAVEELDAEHSLPELRKAEIVSRAGPNVVLSHPLYGEVVRDHLGPARVREIQGRLADALLAEPDPNPSNVLRAANWKLESGDCPPELASRGAQYALTIFDGPLAQRLAEAAQAADKSWLPQALLAQALFVQQRSVEAEAAFARVELPKGDPHAVGRVAAARALNLAFGLGDAPGAKEVLTAAAEPLGEPFRASLLAHRALFDALLGDFYAVLANAGPLVDATNVDSVHRLRALISYTLAQGMCGRLGRFDELITVAKELAEEHRTVMPMARVQIGLNEAFGLAGLGRLDDALDRIEFGHERALREDGVVALWGGQRGGVLMQAGRLAEAAPLLRENQRYMGDFDPFRTNPMHLAYEAVVLAMGGDGRGAEETLERAERETLLIEPRFQVHVGRTRGWLAVGRGEIDEAIEILVETGESVIKATHILWGCEVLHDVVRLGSPGLVVDRLDAAVSETEDAPYLEAMLEHANALADDDSAALEAVGFRFRGCGARLLAAEAMAQAAASHAGHDRDRDEQRAATRSMIWQRECGDVDTPALAARPPSLTAREFEVATFVAGGITSKAVADRLFLSVRTVDNHLRRVYNKLGMTDRTELAVFWTDGIVQLG